MSTNVPGTGECRCSLRGPGDIRNSSNPVTLHDAFVQNLPVLLGIQVVRGLGFGSYTASAMTYATEQGGHEDGGSNSGMFNAMSSAGMLTGTMLGGTVAQAFGFTTLYALCAVMATGAGACFLALRHQGKRAAQLAAEGNA